MKANMTQDETTKELITYLIEKHPNASVTVLMKLCYLIDLVSIKELGDQITNFKYIRYNFGPFDKGIYDYIETLTSTDVLTQKQEYTSTGKEFIIYEVKNEQATFSSIKDPQIEIINKVLNNVAGHGAKGLTQIAYKTKPMISIGAEMDNTKGLHQLLNLSL